MSELTVLGVLGLPGAGKTTAATALAAERDDVYLLTMSDVASREFDKVYQNGIDAFSESMQEEIHNSDTAVDEIVPSEDTSKALADFAGAVMSVRGTYFSKRAVEWVDTQEVERCVVDGIRSLADVDGFTEASDEFKMLYIHTPFSVRLDRLQSRGRDSEQDADAAYLIDRDNQELGWGVDEILGEHQPNMFYNNFDSEEEFTDRFVEYVTERL